MRGKALVYSGLPVPFRELAEGTITETPLACEINMNS